MHRDVATNTTSIGCLGCHDGVLAPETTRHPVGSDYSAALLRPELKLRPFATLPASVRLEDGRIGCTSCHDLASPLPARLAMSNRGSALCFACHAL